MASMYRFASKRYVKASEKGPEVMILQEPTALLEYSDWRTRSGWPCFKMLEMREGKGRK